MQEDGSVGWRVQAPDATTWRVRRRRVAAFPFPVLLGRRRALVATSDRGEAFSVEVSGWHASREKAAQVLELLGAAGVRQPWRSGPPGWWAGVVVDNTYARAYVRSRQEELGANMVTDALKRAVAGGG